MSSLRIALVAMIGIACAATACKSNGDDSQIQPGGGGPPGGSTHPDAPASDGALNGDGGAIIGRVCYAVDSRQLTACAGTGVGGLTVALGAATAVTIDDGSFEIAGTTDGNGLWHVSGTAVPAGGVDAGSIGTPMVDSFMPQVLGTEIPVLSVELYEDMLDTQGVILVDGEGSLMARLLSAGTPARGATLASEDAIGDVFYDSSAADVWNTDATGTFGVAWIPQLQSGTTASVVARAAGATGSGTTVSGIPIEDEAITFIAIEL